jgi:hypothetical protein
MTPENLYVVPMETLTFLRALKTRRDEQAFIAGCAILEHEIRKEQIIEGKYSPDERNSRLGALYYDLDLNLKQCLRLVRASETDQRALGEQALLALGLDPKADEYTIEPNSGAVLRLREGQWRPLERSPA